MTAWIQGMWIGLRGMRGTVRGVYMGYGGLGLGALKDGSTCSSSPNTPYRRIPLSPSFPSGDEPGNGEGELDSERQAQFYFLVLQTCT